MREIDMFEEITEMEPSRGTMTYDAADDMLAPEFLPHPDASDHYGIVDEIGDQFAVRDESFLAEEEPAQDESAEEAKTEDLVQAYFHSMGNIPILTRAEEAELAKRLNEGKEIMAELLTAMPLYRSLERSADAEQEEAEEERSCELIQLTMETVGGIMEKVAAAEKSISRYGALKDLRKTIQEKRKKEIDATKEERAADLVRNEYRFAEIETGVKIDELKARWERILRAKALYTEAKNEMITRNLRLVINIAKNYIGRGLPILDLIQEGNIGLMRAVDRFKYEKGFKFSTYATWWIRQAITRSLMDQTKTIRVPVHIMEFYNKIIKVSREMTHSLGREPENKEIARKMGIPVERIEEIFGAIQDPIALQTKVGEEDSELEDFISDHNSISPYTNAERKELSGHILSILKTLTPKEEKVIRMRFGIGLDRDHTLEEVGRHLSITRERVRQIEVSALRRLKHPSRLRILKVLSAS